MRPDDDLHDDDVLEPTTTPPEANGVYRPDPRGFAPAFPGPFASAGAGLTIREYYAAAALTGLLASDPDGHLTYPEAADFAVVQADALLERLRREGGVR